MIFIEIVTYRAINCKAAQNLKTGQGAVTTTGPQVMGQGAVTTTGPQVIVTQWRRRQLLPQWGEVHWYQQSSSRLPSPCGVQELQQAAQNLKTGQGLVKPYPVESLDNHNDWRIERKQNNVAMDMEMKQNNVAMDGERKQNNVEMDGGDHCCLWFKMRRLTA